METIKSVLINRDGLTPEQADEAIDCAKNALGEYLESGDLDSAHDICEEFFGLEPDYIMELLQ